MGGWEGTLTEVGRVEAKSGVPVLNLELTHLKV